MKSNMQMILSIITQIFQYFAIQAQLINNYGTTKAMLIQITTQKEFIPNRTCLIFNPNSQVNSHQIMIFAVKNFSHGVRLACIKRG